MIDIVIPVHNALDYLKKCLFSLEKYTEDYRLILVDDDSDSETRKFMLDYIQKHKSFVLLTNSNHEWFTRTSNRGLRFASSEFVVLLNSDTEVSDGWLDELIRIIKKYPKAVLVGSDHNPEIEFDYKKTEYPDYVTGHCWLLRKKLLVKLRYLDSSTSEGMHYNSDRWFCYKANNLNYDTLVSYKSHVIHHQWKSWEHQPEVLEKLAKGLYSKPKDFEVYIDSETYENALFSSLSPIGDTMNIIPVLKAFRRDNPDTVVTLLLQDTQAMRIMENLPYVDEIVYEDVGKFGSEYFQSDVYKLKSEYIKNKEFNLSFCFDPHWAADYGFDLNINITEAYAKLFGIIIDENKPTLFLDKKEEKEARKLLPKGTDKWVIVSPHSRSNVILNKGDFSGNKTWLKERWDAVIDEVLYDHPDWKIVVIGDSRNNKNDYVTDREGVVFLYGENIRHIASLIKDSVMTVTVDNAINHICHAFNTREVLIYPEILPLNWCSPVQSENAYVIYNRPSSITIDEVLKGINEVSRRNFNEKAEYIINYN
jgi:ADP-heptose:LPS heptosyltransferase